jgi:putative flippase GtrA
MKVMNVVWPVNAWFLGPFGYWAYKRIGLQSVKKQQEEVNMQQQSKQQDNQSQKHHQQQMQQEQADKPLVQKAFTGSTHCATGCTLGDVIAEWWIFFGALSIFGLTLYASFLIDFIFAYILGIVFQYFSIVPMRKMMEGKKLSKKDGLKEAIKADTLSLTAYEVGLFFWMGLTQLVFFHPRLEATEPTFWFMMQIGMALGLLTTYPVNMWLVKKGIKHGM